MIIDTKIKGRMVSTNCNKGWVLRVVKPWFRLFLLVYCFRVVFLCLEVESSYVVQVSIQFLDSRAPPSTAF